MMKTGPTPTTTTSNNNGSLFTPNHQQQQQQHQQQRHSPTSTTSSSSSTMSPLHQSNSYQQQQQQQQQSSSANNNNQTILEVKSKYDAEFRRVGLIRSSVNKYSDFYQLIERLHGLNGIQFNICYTDKDGDLLPINNDMNLGRVLNVTVGILRLIIQRKGECYNPNDFASGSQNRSYSYNVNGVAGGMNDLNPNNQTSASYRTTTNFISRFKELKDSSLSSSSSHHHHANPKAFQISYPEDFRPVSAIIDVDILPDTYRRVRLHKHKSSKPLGFYIRDGRSLRVTPQGVEQVPGIFISRLMPGGLAESTGLLSVNDEVIEVNGIEVAGKTLDQVTDMMVANSSNLIITVKPTNQRFNLNRSSHNNTVISSSTPLNTSRQHQTTAQLPNLQQQQQQQQQQHHQKTSGSSLTTTPLSQTSNRTTPTTTNNNNNGYKKASGDELSSSSSSMATGRSAPANKIAISSSLKNDAPQAPSTTSTTGATGAAADLSSQNLQQIQQHLQNQHIDDEDDDDEEIHDATGANGSFNEDDDDDADNSDDKILTL